MPWVRKRQQFLNRWKNPRREKALTVATGLNESDMEKFCVFCGARPEGKNKEHVIPLWLIEKTGDPNRTARFGVDFRRNPPAIREFSFDSLTFPACGVCNGQFSNLEADAKDVIERLLACQLLSEIDLSILLDWFDKVRIGLWLGYLYLNGNPLEINPSYHISTRLGLTDRALGIIRISGRQPGINFIGPESPCFQGNPTCFAFLINDFCFFNVAGISICSRRLGFPFAKPTHLRDDGLLQINIETGTGRIRRPVQRDLILSNTVLLHQPIYRQCFGSGEARKLFETQWVRDRSLQCEDGYGGVFIEKADSVCRYLGERSLDWLPDGCWSLDQVYSRITPLVYNRLIRDVEQGANISGRERRQRMMEGLRAFRKIHNAILSGLTHQAKPKRKSGR